MACWERVRGVRETTASSDGVNDPVRLTGALEGRPEMNGMLDRAAGSEVVASPAMAMSLSMWEKKLDELGELAYIVRWYLYESRSR